VQVRSKLTYHIPDHGLTYTKHMRLFFVYLSQISTTRICCLTLVSRIKHVGMVVEWLPTGCISCLSNKIAMKD